jgi:hypothetical protein
MKVFHQTGHVYKWNLDSYVTDKAGDGLILSPINISYTDVLKLPNIIKKSCIFDSQFYIPNDNKGKLETYDFFPANMKEGFSTVDFDEVAEEVAGKNIKFQAYNNFEYYIIPTKYYEFLPENYHEQLNEFIINPFLAQINQQKNKKKVILSIIVKQEQLLDESKRDELLNWVTGIGSINGVYLIFENKFASKQIKDPNYLYNALVLIKFLKNTDLEVHIGYTNTEGLLYSIAGPDSISMGSYENLRSFNINRFITPETKKAQRGPAPRLYSGKLLQWIEYGFIESFISLFSDWQLLFEESRHNPLLFKKEYHWHFNKPELYKHYFIVFSSQVKGLPQDLKEREIYLRKAIDNAINLFDNIKKHVYLDSDSDGSHLYHWMNSITMYEDFLRRYGYEF